VTPRKKSEVKPLESSRILVVDDHPIVREGLAEAIDNETDLCVCGEAEDRHQAIAAIQAGHPDLVIVDLKLKDSDGFELIKDIHARWPKLPMLVVSMYEESVYAERVIRAGARGYITKQEATRKIIEAVRRVLSGSIYLNDSVAAHLLSRLATGGVEAVTSPADLLADRELQVFELTGLGLNTHRIAARLGVAPKTVETYRARIRDKLDLQDASELLEAAIAWSHRPRA